MNKNILTNIISFTVMILGAFSPIYQNILFSIGLFSLSGGLTNWLAIYMLFEKIPFVYGSGIIPNKFEIIKYCYYFDGAIDKSPEGEKIILDTFSSINKYPNKGGMKHKNK